MALKIRPRPPPHVESRGQKSKNMREAMREQKHRSRQLIVACARKMQEQEADIEQVRTYVNCQYLRSVGTPYDMDLTLSFFFVIITLFII